MAVNTMLIRCYCFSFLAHETDIPHLALIFKWCERTMSDMIVETCGIIFAVLRPTELPRLREGDFLRIAEGFERLRGVPNCIGCIDGKHIQIVAPEDGSLFNNYNDYPSVVLMAVCDANYRFILMSVGALGSESDGGTFGRTKFGNRLKLGTWSINVLLARYHKNISKKG